MLFICIGMIGKIQSIYPNTSDTQPYASTDLSPAIDNVETTHLPVSCLSSPPTLSKVFWLKIILAACA